MVTRLGLCVAAAMLAAGGLVLADGDLSVRTPGKGHCTVTKTVTVLGDVVAQAQTWPERARCTMSDTGFAWDATAAQIGIQDWSVTVGDQLDVDVESVAGRITGTQYTGNFVFRNPKRT